MGRSPQSCGCQPGRVQRLIHPSEIPGTRKSPVRFLLKLIMRSAHDACSGRISLLWSDCGLELVTTFYGRDGRVEDGRGSLGHAATLRFPSPLIEPDVRISRIRLSDWLHREAHETKH